MIVKLSSGTRLKLNDVSVIVPFDRSDNVHGFVVYLKEQKVEEICSSAEVRDSTLDALDRLLMKIDNVAQLEDFLKS